MPDETLQEFNEPGAADTPTAGDAVQMTAKVQIVKRTEGEATQFLLVTDLHTRNAAKTDQATGCVKITLLDGNNPVSSFITCSPRNEGRGMQPATERDVHEEHLLPPAVKFDGLGFLFYNDDHRGQEILNLENFGKAVGIVAAVVGIIRGGGSPSGGGPSGGGPSGGGPSGGGPR